MPADTNGRCGALGGPLESLEERELCFGAGQSKPVDLPALRERAEDILPLAERFLWLLSREAGSTPKKITKAASAILEQYSWPGNVRELKHLIERAFVLSEDDLRITPDLLSLPLETL